MAVLGGWMQIANSKCKEWVRGDKLHEIGGAEKTVVLFAHCYQYIISSSSILKKKRKKAEEYNRHEPFVAIYY